LTRQRDTQRSRLYKAEKVLTSFSERLETPEEIATFLTKVCNRAPIQRRYGLHLRRSIEVHDGRRRRNACAWVNYIKMPKWARTQYIVLHEAAHSINLRKHGTLIAAHGREYAAIYLDLVRFGLGTDAHAALKTSFAAHKVKFRPKRGSVKARPAFQATVAFQAAAKPKPVVRRDTSAVRAYTELRKLEKEHGFTHRVVLDGGTSYFETDTFPGGRPFVTLHYSWPDTLQRVKLCLSDLSLLDEEGGYTE